MVFFRGQYIAKQDAHVSIDDRGYYFGDGLYEVFRYYNRRLFEPELHMNRLVRTAAALKIHLPYTPAEIEAIAARLVQDSETDTGIVYMQITRGEAPRKHQFPDHAEPVMLAYAQHFARPLQAIEHGISVTTTEDIRWLRCDLKTLNLLPNTLMKQEAVEKGADEVILHRNGTVTECSANNVHMVKNGTLITHPANNLILHGVTRAVLLRLARSANIEVSETPFTLEQLADADEVIISGTTYEASPIVRVDGKPVRDGKAGPVTRQLQRLFHAHAQI